MSLKAADFYLFRPRDWNKTQITEDIKGRETRRERALLITLLPRKDFLFLIASFKFRTFFPTLFL